jgi:MaoC like domain
MVRSGKGGGHVTDATKFDPAEHRFGPTHWFEDLQVGQKFYINSRTQTESLFGAFQLASGDNHPIHYDREYCRARGHRDMLAHGLQVAIQGAAGAGVFPEAGLLRRHALSDAGGERAQGRPHHRHRHDESHDP